MAVTAMRFLAVKECFSRCDKNNETVDNMLKINTDGSNSYENGLMEQVLVIEFQWKLYCGGLKQNTILFFSQRL
jgi:hypothetical protein